MSARCQEDVCRLAAFIEFLSCIFSSTSIPSTTSSNDLWSNVPAPTTRNHAHWSFPTPFQLLSTSSPPVAGRRIAVFPVQVRRAALIGYRQCHVMILVPPQRSGLRVCVCVASIHPSWGDGHPTGSSHRSGDSGQVGMAVVLACAVPRHSLRSPGFRIHAGPALCGDRSVPSMGLVARARSCCSRSGIGETVPWTCVAGFLNCQPEMPAVSVTSATVPGIRMVRSDTDLRGNSQWPSSAPVPWLPGLRRKRAR